MPKLTVVRVFSSPEINPYDQINWTKKTVAITDDHGKTLFEQKDVEVPESWTDLAVKIVASKYFYGAPNTPQRENSVRKLVHRVAKTICNWGVETGYFDEANGQVFYDELSSLCLNQCGVFNSPVWFNVGLWHEYKAGAGGTSGGWAYNYETGQVEKQTLPYLRPQGSACFIQGVEDNMDSIMALATSEAMLFKFGSGTGTDLTPIRSSKETLSGGGRPSGPMSFLKVYDQVANTVKSGGKCLAPYQRVWTEKGPKPVKELAELGQDFVVLSYDPPAGRVKAKWARAWHSGQKRVVRVETDKGNFDVSFDHPFRLSHGDACQAGQLVPGQSIFAANTLVDDYIRVGFDKSPVRATLFHRMIAQDIMGLAGDNVVHHVNGDGLDNSLDNIEVLSNQAVHASLHGHTLVEHGTHPFQLHKFDVSGLKNGMHLSGDFHNNPEKVSEWKQRLSTKSKKYAAKAQKASAAQKILNNAYELINKGLDITTPEAYNMAMDRVFSRGRSHATRNEAIQQHFGSHEQLITTLAERNHRVIRVVDVGAMDVYSVEVDCPTADDKSATSGHNYAICCGDGLEQHLAFVFNTRRAAKMNTLRDWHPDIEEFIVAKMVEEKKVQALIKAGYNGSFNGEAYATVAYQNENLSVRVSDGFMQAAINGDKWPTRSITSGEIIEEKDASKLLDLIAEGTWTCGDPGLQYDGAIQRWHTCKGTEPIHSTNPCSEYVFINNTACNLASLNLMKFRDKTGIFDVEKFKAASRIFILAQEILVNSACYPTKLIAENSHIFRTLGLGYANLGSLIMSYGLPYDSVEGNTMAGSIAALMTGEAYKMSAQIASIKGPFNGYNDSRCSHVKNPIKDSNKASMLEVIHAHREEAEKLFNKNVSLPQNLNSIIGEAVKSWQDAESLGKLYGYRNAQVTVVAPTGTIAFMMDCDTTGIEPDIALVKYKQLAGGGSLKIVNNTVPIALQYLGYSEQESTAITDYIFKHDTIEDVEGEVSGLKPEHLPIFDCALKAAKGQRSIAWMAHLKVMAAVQPFISGAISKTVNMIGSATADDIKSAYIEAWKLGLKCVAIYRHGSKWSQPLNTSRTADVPELTELKALEAKVAKLEAELIAIPHGGPRRERLGDTREAVTHKFNVGGQEGYITVGLYGDGRPGELFIQMSKEGSTLGGLMDTIGTLTSISLQYGVPLETLVEKFSHQRFEPHGYTSNPKLRSASSIIDYIFRWMETEFHNEGKRDRVLDSVKQQTPSPVTIQNEYVFGIKTNTQAHPIGQCCGICGSSNIQISGTCFTCTNCGTSLGCS